MAKYSGRFIYNSKQEQEDAHELAARLSVKASSVFDLVSSLSGGNQQKVVVAKALTAELKIIIMDEPTKGVDVGAKAAIYEIMASLSEQGYGILLISSEMPEVLGMADRVIVMKAGRISAEFEIFEATQEKILEASMISEDKPVGTGEQG